MKQRVLFVVGSLSPGGAERVVSLLANECARLGVEVGILTIKPREDVFPLDPRVERVRIDISGSSKSLAGAIRGFLARRKHIRETVEAFRPTVVFSFLNYVNIRVLDALKGVPFPVFVSERNTISAISGLKWRLLRRLLYDRADGLVVQTVRQRREFERYNEFIPVIPNPLELPQNVSFEEKEPIILLVGRMSHQKQFDTFLKHVPVESLGEYRIVIAGEFRDPMKQRIDRFLQDSPLADKVTLLGHTDDLDALYRRAAVFVLSSRYEGFPNALSEALAYGCACVAFDCPNGPAEMIDHGTNGLLVKAQDWDALINGIKEVVDDKSLRSRLFINAIEGQKKFDLSRIARRWLALVDASFVEDQ